MTLLRLRKRDFKQTFPRFSTGLTESVLENKMFRAIKALRFQ